MRCTKFKRYTKGNGAITLRLQTEMRQSCIHLESELHSGLLPESRRLVLFLSWRGLLKIMRLFPLYNKDKNNHGTLIWWLWWLRAHAHMRIVCWPSLIRSPFSGCQSPNWICQCRIVHKHVHICRSFFDQFVLPMRNPSNKWLVGDELPQDSLSSTVSGGGKQMIGLPVALLCTFQIQKYTKHGHEDNLRQGQWQT